MSQTTYTRDTVITSVSIALHNLPGQDANARMRASIRETLTDQHGNVAAFPETRSQPLQPADVTDDMIAQINTAIAYAGVQLSRIEGDDA